MPEFYLFKNRLHITESTWHLLVNTIFFLPKIYFNNFILTSTKPIVLLPRPTNICEFFPSKVSKLRPRSRRFEIFGEVDSLSHQVAADTNIFVDIRTLERWRWPWRCCCSCGLRRTEPIVSGASLIGRNNADENWRQNFWLLFFLWPLKAVLWRSRSELLGTAEQEQQQPMKTQ